MKAVYELVKALLWLNIGVFIGNAVCEYSFYTNYPEIFAVQSAPWFLSIQINAVFTSVITLILGAILLVMKKKIKNS